MKKKGTRKGKKKMVEEFKEVEDFEKVKEDGLDEEDAPQPDWIPYQPLKNSNYLLHPRVKRWWKATLAMIRKTAHPIGILLAGGFRYLGGEFLCWMLLGGIEA